jgi:hypothetical protein
MKELLIKLLEFLGLACWIEISTENPRCIYYFGPFFTQSEAESSQNGYIEDLKAEGAMGISVKFKRCKPQELTIFDEVEELGKLTNFSTKMAMSN